MGLNEIRSLAISFPGGLQNGSVQMRRDPLRGHWSFTALKQGSACFSPPSSSAKETPASSCPLCPGNEHLTPPEIAAVRPSASRADQPGWQVRVFPNDIEVDLAIDTTPPSDDSLYVRREIEGRQEIIVATPEHGRRIVDFGVDHWDAVLATVQYRMAALSQNNRALYTGLFFESGEKGRFAQSHTHFRLASLPMVPRQMGVALRCASAHRQKNKSNLFGEIIARECADGSRIVHQSDDFVTFAPWASRVPFELSLFPRVARCSFLEVPPRQRKGFAAHLVELLAKWSKVLGATPFHWILHSVSVEVEGARDFSWHVELIPCLLPLGSFEWGSGEYVNPISPENAAKQFRGGLSFV